jgi:hypothetical protein
MHQSQSPVPETGYIFGRRRKSSRIMQTMHQGPVPETGYIFGRRRKSSRIMQRLHQDPVLGIGLFIFGG